MVLLANFEDSTMGSTAGIISPYHDFSEPTAVLVRARVHAEKNDSLARLEVRLVSRSPYSETPQTTIYPGEEFANYPICAPGGMHALLFTATMGGSNNKPSVLIESVTFGGTCSAKGNFCC